MIKCYCGEVANMETVKFCQECGATLFTRQDMFKHKIVVTMRCDDYHACFQSYPERWGCGKTIAEAVGNCIIDHGEKIDIGIIEM